jgi:hypothetical protein
MSSTTVSLSNFGLNGRIHKLLADFGYLRNNWDEDDALAPSKEALRQAEFLTGILEKHGQPIFHAAPGPNGEVMLDIRNKDKSKSVEILFYQNRTTVVFYPSKGSPYQDAFDFQALPEILVWLNDNK